MTSSIRAQARIRRGFYFTNTPTPARGAAAITAASSTESLPTRRNSQPGEALTGRKLDPECAAFSGFRFKAYAAAHSLGCLFGNRQSNACSFVAFVNALKDA